ncbi:lysylphosphatidylglycerol synthase domain-containing protein [Rickettsiales bacterium]|nr:lysylphosphatidylglycerol synthase domain-containing protein [Rickettsiales bacterium]
MKFKQLKTILIFFIGFGAIYWVYKFFAGPESINYITAHKEKLFLLIFAHIPTLYFDALSWKMLMKRNYLGIYWCFIITWISQTGGKVMPTGNVTGEFIRMYLSVKKGMKLSEASSTVIGDLALAAFSLLIMSVFSLMIVIFSNQEFSIVKGENKYLGFSILFLILASIIFCIMIRKRVLKFLIRKSSKFITLKLKKNIISNLIKFDFELYLLSYRLKTVFFALIVRAMGWIGGALEIFIFLLIIGVNINIMDVVIIESFTAIMRAMAFFIPAGLGVQEFAFVLVGNFVGLTSPIAFAVAIGRRIREILVGIPALIAWYFLFKKQKL